MNNNDGKTKVHIEPWKPGDKGFLCMPLKRNIPEPHADGHHLDWKIKNCPKCGEECWESEDSRTLQSEHGLTVLCTMCALKKGLEHGKRGNL